MFDLSLPFEYQETIDYVQDNRIVDHINYKCHLHIFD